MEAGVGSGGPPRILGLGKRSENAESMQQLLRDAGYDAHNFAIDDSPDGDAAAIAHLQDGPWHGVVIGSFINGQHAELPASAATTAWFNRLLNLIVAHAPGARVVLVRKPSEVVATVARVLADG